MPGKLITVLDSTAFRGSNANSSEEMMPHQNWKGPQRKTIMAEHWGGDSLILRSIFKGVYKLLRYVSELVAMTPFN